MALGEVYTVDGFGNMNLRHGYHRGWRTTWKCIVPGDFGGDAHTDFLFYDPAEGTGEFYTMYVNGTISLSKAHRGGWRKTWQAIVPGNFGGGPHTDLLFYDRSQGTVEIYTTDGQGNIALLKAYSGTWGKNWDLVVPGTFSGGAYTDLLFYDRTAGTGAFYRLGNQGNLTLFREYTGGWRKTWDIIVAGQFGDWPNSGLLFYDRRNKTGEFYATDGQGTLSLLKKNAGTWRATWDLIVPLALSNDYACSLLFYDAESGTGEFYGVDNQGNIKLLRGFEKQWRTSWRQIVPCQFNRPALSHPALLFYSPVGFTVLADPGVMQTGIKLKRGDLVSLHARGRMAAVGDHGPGGIHELAAASWPEPGLRRFCLYARYGREYVVPFPHPEDESTAHLRFTALADGELSLHVNDDNSRGRSGGFEVDVRVKGGDPPAVKPFSFYIPADAGRSGTSASSERVYRSLNAGDVIVVEAFGRMNCGAALAADSGPAGENNAQAPAHFPAPDLPPYSLYVEVGRYDQVLRRLALQGQKDAPYGAVRFVAQAGESWIRVRLNDAPLTDNRGGFHVFVWKNAQGQHLGQYGVHVAQPILLKETGGAITDYRQTGRAFPRGMHSISPYAIRQVSGIGNCWQMSALAALAHTHPHLIREMIDDHQDGTYTVRIYDNLGGKRVSLLLDSNLPSFVASGLEPDGSLSVLWPALLQKAHFFINGFGYKPIDEGSTSTVPWDDLTNTPTDWTLFAAEQFRDWLKKGVCRGRPMVASTFRLFAWDLFNPEARLWNLIRDHVYALLDCRQTGGPDGDWELYILNPHRRNEYKPGQSKSETSKDGDGFFWMPMSKAGEVFGSLWLVPLPDSLPKADLYKLHGNGQLAHVWSANWRSWNVITPVRWGNKVGFLCHRYQDKEASLQELDPNTGNLTQVWSDHWGHCWQIIVPVTFGGHTGILSFARNANETTGKDESIVCLDRFGADGKLTEVWRGMKEPPWDVVIPFNHGNKSGVIKHQYRNATGYAEFQISTFDTAGKLRVESSLTSGEPAWNVMVPLNFGQTAAVFSHAFADRGAALHMLDDSIQINENTMHFATWWRERWGYDWDMIVPVSWGAGNQGLLSYDLDTATMCLDRFGSDRKLTEEWRRVHQPRPNMLVPLRAKDTTWILTHAW